MGMRNLSARQWSPCGSGGGGDCLVLEVEDAATGKIRISDTDKTFSGVIEGHEVEQFVRAYNDKKLPPQIQSVIDEDVARNAAEMSV
jgi:hypothetical protein